MGEPAFFRVAVAGAGGRMGRMLIEAVQSAPDCVLAGAFDMPGSPALGQDACAFMGRASGVTVTDQVIDGLSEAGVLIDFTRPAGTLAHLEICRSLGIAAVIGTTGFTDEEKARIADAARDIPIVFAPNMSVGVNVTLRLLEVAARALATGYDIEVIEAHHRQKVDAPSGTAVALGRAVARGRGTTLEAAGRESGRDGHTGPRGAGTIGFAALRGGQVVGEHSVIFAAGSEHIILTHRAFDRRAYANGAVRAAIWAAARPPGLYSMADVLGMRG